MLLTGNVDCSHYLPIATLPKYLVHDKVGPDWELVSQLCIYVVNVFVQPEILISSA